MNSKLVIMDKKSFDDVSGITTSKMIGDVFFRDHKNVLRDIENLKQNLTAQFWAANFKESTYKSRGKEYKQYILSKDGFIMLVMGYTGKEAVLFKEKYIARFNEMERYIKSREMAKAEFPALTESIKENHEEIKNYHFSNEIDMINRIVLGRSSKQYKEDNEIEGELRDNLTEEQIYYIRKLQIIDAGFIYAIPDFQERKTKLKEYYNKLKDEYNLKKITNNDIID